MKKFLIIYIIFSLVLLAFIYFFTLIQETNKRTLIVYYELAEEAYETGDLDTFLKYQSIAYQHLYTETNTDYAFHVYHVIAQLDDAYINQFSVFVMPKRAVNHASHVRDSADRTRMILTDVTLDAVIYTTDDDPEYAGYAVSYGIEVIGFYFYAMQLPESRLLRIELFDYDNHLIFDQTVDYVHIDYPEDDPGTLTMGYTRAELETLFDLATYMQPAMIQNITLFLIVDIFIGGVIYYILKHKKDKTADSKEA
ncbi:MAG: hypothetical protein EA375_03095 [Acholeplasmataceae bacterium]|nr:MAG: hypothetical protein EA375_03095 [Acholeplasmataceae bacterium]